MQEKQFDNLMEGKPAKWVENLQINPDESKLKTLNRIKDLETPIPKVFSIKVARYIQNRRDNGDSEEVIRKAVKKKFHIETY